MEKCVRGVPIKENASKASTEKSVDISLETHVSEVVVKEQIEKLKDKEYSEGMEGQESDYAEEEDQSAASLEMGLEVVETGIDQEQLKKNHMSRAQKRRMKGRQAMAAGEKVLSEVERKKRKPEEDTQNSDTNTDTKKLKTSSNANDPVTKEVDKNRTGVSGRKVRVKNKTSASMRLAVVLEGFPDVRMTEEQAEVVGTALLEKINPSHQGEPIQFSATQYENGGLVFTCANKATKTWLNEAVHKIVPWPGARLTLGQADKVLNGTKLVLWVSWAIKKRDSQQILDLLQKQNKGISIATWKVLKRAVEADKRHRLTLWVDNKSFEDLKAGNFRLFLGLRQVKLMLASKWEKLMNSNTSTNWNDSRPAVQNPPRPPANYKPRQPVAPKLSSQNLSRPAVQNPPQPPANNKSRQPVAPKLSSQNLSRPVVQNPPRPPVNYKPRQPIAPKLSSKKFPYPRVTDLGPRSFHQSQRSWRSRPNPRPHVSRFEHQGRPQRHELQLEDMDVPLFRKTVSMTSDGLSLQKHTFTESHILQTLESRFPASEKPHDPRFSTLEQSQSRETSYIVSDRAQHREPRYTLDRPHETRYIPSDLQQSRETHHGTTDPPLLHEKRFTVSDWLLPQEVRSMMLDQAPSQDSRYMPRNGTQSLDCRYVIPNQAQYENPRLRDSGQLLSRDSRLRCLDEPSFQETRFRGSDQMQSRESGFMKSDPLYSREPRLRLSDPQQLREFDSTSSSTSRSREERFSGSDFPPNQSRSSYKSLTLHFLRPSDSSQANW